MRVIPVLVFLLLASPSIASAQSFLLHGSAGPTIIDNGYSVAGGLGLSPTSHLTVLFDVERTHLSSRLRSDGRGGFAGFRGGTLTLGSAQLRVTPLGRDRVGPYGLVGFAPAPDRRRAHASACACPRRLKPPLYGLPAVAPGAKAGSANTCSDSLLPCPFVAATTATYCLPFRPM